LFPIDSLLLPGIPGLDWNPTYAGHLCNDGARLIEGGEASVASYVLSSNAKHNAMHTDIEGLHIATVATRPIKAGDEILVTYGPDYWLEHDLRNKQNGEGGTEDGNDGFWDLSSKKLQF
jgi:hypothetical protein